MLADFCHSLWDTRIDCDTVSSEGYEVSNLISRDKFKKKRGFLAARFVKPVVTILVSFPFPVDLYAVNLNPQVGAQKTCGLEMFSASLKSRNDQDKSSGCSAESVTTPVATQEKDGQRNTGTRNTGQPSQDISAFHLYQYDLNTDNVKHKFKNLFVQILRVRISEGNVGHFVNPCFQQNAQVHCDSKIVGNASSNVHKCMLQHGHSLRSLSHLLIRITQVHRGSVPCLGAVEMFARPAQNCHPFVMDYASIIHSRLEREKQDVCNGLFGVAKRDNSLPTTPLYRGGNGKVSKPISLIQNGENCVVDNVPDDFIDPITLNVMTLPVLLPSGTTIDHTTLEKHIASEKSWGRSPSDPFTGLPLGSKVVPNPSLKYRIDNFLLSSDVDISNLGRTIGSLTDCQSTTKLKFNAVKQKNTAQKYRQKNKRTTFVSGVNDNEPPLKRHSPGVDHLSDSLDQALEEALNVRRHPVHDSCSKNVSVSSLVPATFGSKANGSKMNLERENSAEESSHACPHHEQAEKLFQLPCQHIICRGCLPHATEHNQCPNCKRNFERKSIVRVHSVKTPID